MIKKTTTITTQHTQIAAHSNRNTHTHADRQTHARTNTRENKGANTRTNKVVCTRRGWGSTVFAASFWFCYSFSFCISLSLSHTRSWLWNTFDRGTWPTTTATKAACRDRIGKQEERRAVREVRIKRGATRERERERGSAVGTNIWVSSSCA